ncbi:MAG TPA: hypothetical protein VGI16_02770 [Candidatus Acidoferrum sp.]|jgi:hypothetical protein
MNAFANSNTFKTLISIEHSLIIAVVLGLVAFFFPRLGARSFRFLEHKLSALASHRVRAIFILFFAVIALRVLLLPLLRVPVPGIHDEFSYLLMGDTFAHGRLANPPHPMWVSFETFHVNWFPTYSSMYPPAQGFVLAIGQLLGNPWIGVLLSTAAMCAAIFWMLLGWMPSRWALAGAAMAALKLGIASYWMNSYWGGSVAAIGGALVLGALPRIVKRGKARDAILLGLGIAILANSRPYEGILFCIPGAIWLLWWLGGKTKSWVSPGERVRRVLLPLCATLLLTAVFMGYYNWRLTGNPLLLPHRLNARTYNSVPLFLWQHPAPQIEYRNQQFEDFYNLWQRQNYYVTARDIARVSGEKIFRGGLTYLWVGILLALPGAIFVLRDRRMRVPLITLLVCGPGVFIIIWSNPHYAAPLTCVIFAMLVQSLRHLRTMQFSGHPVGLALSRAVIILLAIDTATNAARHVCDPLLWPCQGDISRVAITKRLENTPGKHLVVVRYAKDHNIHDEWVYNAADIDAAKIVWARDIDAVQNAKLFAYFKDRHIWVIDPDVDNTTLLPYSVRDQNSPASAAE